MKQSEEQISREALYHVLSGCKIPLLTLDEKWYELFAWTEKPEEIAQYEHVVNDILKEQGRLINENKDLKRVKQKTMAIIVDNMEETTSERESKRRKTLSKTIDIIEEVNQKIIENENQLEAIPSRLKEANLKLMVESCKLFFDQIYGNRKLILKMDEWIDTTSRQLEGMMAKRSQIEKTNQNMYQYMHSILGARITEMIDRKYEEET